MTKHEGVGEPPHDLLDLRLIGVLTAKSLRGGMVLGEVLCKVVLGLGRPQDA